MIYDSILFGICLSAAAYWLGKIINSKINLPLTNPLLVAVILCICVLEAFSIPLDSYMKGGGILSALVFPATAALGLSIYRQLPTLKKYWLPILIGTVSSCICSIGTTWILFKAFGIDREIMLSFFPKSVTTAVAIDIANQIGGNAQLAVFGVVTAGLIGGAVLAPTIMRILHFKNPIALGVAFGTNHHAIGTARAMEISEQIGAISGTCIGTEALVTTIAIILLGMFGLI